MPIMPEEITALNILGIFCRFNAIYECLKQKWEECNLQCSTLTFTQVAE